MRALYYPHTQILNESLVKTSLILWDQVEYISPDNYDPINYNWGDNEHLRRAVSLFGLKKTPTDVEKQKVHNRIQEIIEQGIPDWFAIRDEGNYQDYDVMPEKFLEDTWRLLEGSMLVARNGPMSPFGSPDFRMNSAVGLLIMAVLADVCAHGKRTITDRSSDYAALIRVLTTENMKMVDIDQNVQVDAERLVEISLKSINADAVDINELIRLREDEQRNSGGVMANLRLKYSTEIEKYLERIKTAYASASDEQDLSIKKKDIESDFERAVNVDISALKRELKNEGDNLLLSQGLITAVFVGLGIITQTLPVTLVSMAALSNALFSHKNKRTEIYLKHQMSWLYLTSPSLWYG